MAEFRQTVGEIVIDDIARCRVKYLDIPFVSDCDFILLLTFRECIRG